MTLKQYLKESISQAEAKPQEKTAAAARDTKALEGMMFKTVVAPHYRFDAAAITAPTPTVVPAIGQPIYRHGSAITAKVAKTLN
ncbi:MAG: hypothetical protein WAX89_04935 [Alphaproteobacteria bacterium]